MQSAVSNAATSGSVRTGSLVRAGLIAAVAAAVINLLIYYLAPALFGIALEVPLQGPGSAIEPLPASFVVLASAVPALVAVLLVAALHRFSARPLLIFRTIALIFLLVSLGGPLYVPVPIGVKLTLILMHLVAGATIVYVLMTQTQPD